MDKLRNETYELLTVADAAEIAFSNTMKMKAAKDIRNETEDFIQRCTAEGLEHSNSISAEIIEKIAPETFDENEMETFINYLEFQNEKSGA